MNEEKGAGRTILFVCTGNTCRSPMAQAIFLDRLRRFYPRHVNSVQVISAGLAAPEGYGASREAVQAAGRRGLDLSLHKTTPVSEELLNQADLIITMSRSQKRMVQDIAPHVSDRIYTLWEFVDDDTGRDILDPFGGGQETYEQTWEEIDGLIARMQEILWGEPD